EMANDPRGQRRPDPLDRAGTEIALQSGRVLRDLDLIRFHFKLLSISGMLCVASLRLDEFSLRNITENAYTGNLLALPVDDADRVAVLFIPEYDVFHISFYCRLHTVTFLISPWSPDTDRFPSPPPDRDARRSWC